MSDLQSYGISLEVKSAINKLKQFKKLTDQFNKQQKKDAIALKKIIDKETTTKAKNISKQKRQEERFNTWRKTQQRKLIDSQLSSHQKLEIKRVLASKKSEKEIREEYDATLRKFRKNKRLEVLATKAANKKKLASEKANSARLGKIRNGAAMAGQAIVAGVTAGAAMIGMGGAQYADDKANAATAGMTTEQFQQDKFKVAAGSNVTGEQFAEIAKTANERKGSAQFLEKGKDGAFGGADAGATDFLNAIQMKLGKELSLEQGQALLKQGGKTGVDGLLDMRDQMDKLGLSIQDQSFVMESFASDSFTLTEQMKRNSAAVKQAEADYARLGLGIQNTEAVDRVTASFKRMWSTLSAAPMEAFESFSHALSPQTSAVLQQVSEKLIQVSRVIGDWFAKALNDIAPLITKIGSLFTILAPIFENVVNSLAVVGDVLTDAFGMIIDSITNAANFIKAIATGDFSGAFNILKQQISMIFDGIAIIFKKVLTGFFENVVSIMPDWATPSWMSDMVSNNKKDIADHENKKAALSQQKAAVQGASKLTDTPVVNTPVNTPPTAPSQATTSQAMKVLVDVTLMIDSEILGNVIAETSGFNDGVGRVMENAGMSSYD